MALDSLRFVDNLSAKPSLSDEIIIRPQHFTGTEGDVVALVCLNVANVDAPVFWSKSDKSKLPAHIIVRNGILIIQNASVEDTDQYYCQSFVSGAIEMVDVVIVPNENTYENDQISSTTMAPTAATTPKMASTTTATIMQTLVPESYQSTSDTG